MEPLFCRNSYSKHRLYLSFCKRSVVRVFRRYSSRVYWKKLFGYYAATNPCAGRGKCKAPHGREGHFIHVAQMLRAVRRKAAGFLAPSGGSIPSREQGFSILRVAHYEHAGRFRVGFPIPKADIIFVCQNKRLLACHSCPFRSGCIVGCRINKAA